MNKISQKLPTCGDRAEMGFLEEVTVLPSLADPWGFQSKMAATPSAPNVSSSLISGTWFGCFFCQPLKNKVSHYTYTSWIKEKKNTQLNLQSLLLWNKVAPNGNL